MSETQRAQSATATQAAPAGDPLPPVVQTLLDLVGAGRHGTAADAFTETALYAYWDGTGEETDPRTVVEGRAAVAGALERCGAIRLEAAVCILKGSDCFVEGRIVRGDSSETFLASAQLDTDGAIDRCLSYHGPLVDPSSTWDGPAETKPGDAHAILDSYFEHLTDGRFPEAVACFTEDCLYSHPPYSPGAPRAEFRGHAELLAGFEKRGVAPWHHEIVSLAQHGPDCFIEGVVPDVPNGGSFISSLALAADGRIRRYVSFYCSPFVERR